MSTGCRAARCGKFDYDRGACTFELHCTLLRTEKIRSTCCISFPSLFGMLSKLRCIMLSRTAGGDYELFLQEWKVTFGRGERGAGNSSHHPLLFSEGAISACCTAWCEIQFLLLCVCVCVKSSHRHEQNGHTADPEHRSGDNVQCL